MKSSLGMLIILLSCLVANISVEAQEEGTYRIRPADQLNIYVHENPDLTMAVSVLPDGTISYPLVGNLYVQGLTTASLQNILTEELTKFLQNPVVVVMISSQTAYKVYIMGEVRSPGEYPYQEGKRLTDYLIKAGGTSVEANLKKCNIYRGESGKPKMVVNLKEVFENDDQSMNIFLQPDDTVVLERKSAFLVTEWFEVAQILSIFVGVATLYFIVERR